MLMPTPSSRMLDQRAGKESGCDTQLPQSNLFNPHLPQAVPTNASSRVVSSQVHSSPLCGVGD